MHKIDFMDIRAGKTDDAPQDNLSVDGVLATFEIDVTKPDSCGEVWFREMITDSLRTIGLAHPEAKKIIVVFLK